LCVFRAPLSHAKKNHAADGYADAAPCRNVSSWCDRETMITAARDGNGTTVLCWTAMQHMMEQRLSLSLPMSGCGASVSDMNGGTLNAKLSYHLFGSPRFSSDNRVCLSQAEADEEDQNENDQEMMRTT
jgi:hypothetical protein